MQVYAKIRQQVEIDPIDVIKQINVIPEGDWIKIEDGKPVHYTEQSAGQHSFDHKVGILPAEDYAVYLAQQTLLKYLAKKIK